MSKRTKVVIYVAICIVYAIVFTMIKFIAVHTILDVGIIFQIIGFVIFIVGGSKQWIKNEGDRKTIQIVAVGLVIGGLVMQFSMFG